MLLEKLKAKLIALKYQIRDGVAGAKEQAESLTTFIGELNTIQKRQNLATISDDFIITETRKRINGVDDMVKKVQDQRTDSNAAGIQEWVDKAYRERDFFISLDILPTPLSDDQISEILSVNGKLTMKDANEYLKANYPNRYNGKAVKGILDALLASNA